MAGKYLDSDCILALIKETDWLKNDVEEWIKDEEVLFTSIFSIVECKLVISREMKRDDIHDIITKIRERDIRLLPLTAEVEDLPDRLLKRYSFLGIFDSIHAATAIIHGLAILSTDHIFPLIEELSVENPKGPK